MPFKLSSLVIAIATLVAGQALCPTLGLAQVKPKNNPAPARPTWRNFFKSTDISKNGFRSRLKIRNQTRLDGWQVAIVTNVSPSSLYYEGYGPTPPRGFVEELQKGR